MSAQQSVLISDQRATILASAGAANTTTTYTINLPAGGGGGTLYFTFSAAGYAGATIAVTAGPDAAHQVTILAATALAAVSTTQSFTVPATAGAVAQVTYTTAGATAVTYQLAYAYGGVLNLTGTSAVNIAQYGGVATTLGQKVMASSIPTVIASDQSAFTVNIGTFPANQPFNLAQYGDAATTLGQKVMASSIPTVIASDQSAFTVNVGTFPANQPFNLAQVAGTATVTAGIAGLLAVGGRSADNTVLSGNPVLVSGSDGTNARTLLTTDLTNYNAASTLTGVNQAGQLIVRTGPNWGINHNPAVAGTQATITIAAEVGVRHVADCFSYTAGSTTAPAATQVSVNLRDGASGAGTVLQAWVVIFPNSVGQLDFGFCGLNLTGTTNTAMTLEFSAGVANVFEAVSLAGYNVN